MRDDSFLQFHDATAIGEQDHHVELVYFYSVFVYDVKQPAGFSVDLKAKEIEWRIITCKETVFDTNLYRHGSTKRTLRCQLTRATFKNQNGTRGGNYQKGRTNEAATN